MAYVFYDLPADSADLETFGGYHVSRVAIRPRGGPVKRDDPFAPTTELVLSHPRQPWFAPAMHWQAQRPGMARKVPTRAWTLRGFMTTREAASLLSVPALCFMLVWLIGRVW